MNCSKPNILVLALAGIAVGAAALYLLATEQGQDTCERLTESAKDLGSSLKSKVSDRIDDISSRAEELVDNIKSKAKETLG